MALLLCGTLAGCDDLLEICDYGRARLDFLRQDLGLTFPHEIPSEDTLERMLKYLNPSELEQGLRASVQDVAGHQICIDGKEHRVTTPPSRRRVLLRTVTVWLSEEHLSFGQQQIGEKSNEKSVLYTVDDGDRSGDADVGIGRADVVQQARRKDYYQCAERWFKCR